MYLCTPFISPVFIYWVSSFVILMYFCIYVFSYSVISFFRFCIYLRLSLVRSLFV